MKREIEEPDYILSKPDGDRLEITLRGDKAIIHAIIDNTGNSWELPREWLVLGRKALVVKDANDSVWVVKNGR